MPQLTLVLGGAASGKSLYAEGLARSLAGRATYLATAQAFDDEMSEKIARHKTQRGEGWITLEEPLEVPAALDRFQADDTVLLDCATLWLSNIMLAERSAEDESARLIAALGACAATVVVVSNETGMGIVPEHKLGRAFRAAQGLLNQRLAALADRVVFVVAGLPMVLKGAPE